MKKILAFFITLVMVLSTAITSVFAQSDVVIKGDKAVYDLEFEKDKTFDLTFMIENNTEITHGEILIKYDPNVIQAVVKEDNNNQGYFGRTENGVLIKFIDDYTSLNTAINFVPSSLDTVVYDGKSDDVKTSAEIGIIKLVVIHYDGGGLKFLDMKSGKLLTIRFKMVGEGSTTVNLTKSHPKSAAILYRDAEEALGVEVQPITVNLTSSGNSGSETTSSSSSNDNTTTTTTQVQTTEASTEATTSQVTTETISEATTALQEVKTFNDISNYPWAKDAIESLATKGIVNGVGNDMFNPSANVKRADFLLMLMNALDFKGDAKSSFSDVDENMYYANAVCLAKDLGIANGMGDNEFKPNEMISRQDMMVLASKAVKTKIEIAESSADVLDRFSDKAEISAYAQSALAEMVNAGIVNGTGSKIEPKANTTRAQAAVIIYNIYNSVNK